MSNYSSSENITFFLKLCHQKQMLCIGVSRKGKAMALNMPDDERLDTINYSL
jgi:hypothetical protein